MPVDKAFAVECNDRIERQAASYREALMTLNACRDAKRPEEEQDRCLADLHRKATSFFNVVEQSVVDCELLRRHQGEPWARDLANTAVNVLENIAKYYERIREDAVRLHQAAPTPSTNAFSAMQSCVVIYNRDQVPPLLKQFTGLGLPVRGFTHPTPMNTRYTNWEKLIMGGTACVFILLLLAIGVWVTNPTPQSFFIFRTVLALVGGAFAGVLIPGLLQVEGQVKKFRVRAVGAVAFSVIIYLANPPELVKGPVALPAPPASGAPATNSTVR